MYQLKIKAGQLTLAQLRQVSRQPVQLTLDESCFAGVNASTDIVNQVIIENRVAYGINTGFELLANTRIAVEDLETLQRSIVHSHAAGIGEFINDETVRLMMVLKINSLLSVLCFSTPSASISAEVCPPKKRH